MTQFTNQATLSYNGISTNSNVVTGEITQVLNLWKDSTVNSYQVGDTLTYVISIQNAGTSNFTNLTITDNLGAYPFGTLTLVPLTFTGDPILYYQNGILQTSPIVTTSSPLVISGISVLAGTSTIIIYRVNLNEYAPLTPNSTIVNTATLSGGGLIDNITSSNTIEINTEPILTLTKALNPTTVVENGQITYTFTLQNTGTTEANASSLIVINDLFDPILSGISATLNGVAWASTGNYTYDTVTGQFTTIAGQITVPAAVFTQNPITGAWSTTPGITILEVTGTI